MTIISFKEQLQDDFAILIYNKEKGKFKKGKTTR